VFSDFRSVVSTRRGDTLPRKISTKTNQSAAASCNPTGLPSPKMNAQPFGYA
jgi:hypothetical protein